MAYRELATQAAVEIINGIHSVKILSNIADEHAKRRDEALAELNTLAESWTQRLSDAARSDPPASCGCDDTGERCDQPRAQEATSPPTGDPTGNICSNCGSANLIPNGGCLLCANCGTTTGCS